MLTTNEYIQLKTKDKLLPAENDLLLEYNQQLLLQYPFLAVSPDITDFTFMDDIADGWRLAFGDDLLKELKEALIKNNCFDTFQLIQVKEKYGELRIYHNIDCKDVNDVIEKYRNKSRYTCIQCGKPAVYDSLGWICPWCEDCAKVHASHFTKRDFDTLFKKIV